ncbi:unnamed protein product, partial [Nesidiocoris tenuis]
MIDDAEEPPPPPIRLPLITLLMEYLIQREDPVEYSPQLFSEEIDFAKLLAPNVTAFQLETPTYRMCNPTEISPFQTSILTLVKFVDEGSAPSKRETIDERDTPPNKKCGHKAKNVTSLQRALKVLETLMAALFWSLAKKRLVRILGNSAYLDRRSIGHDGSPGRSIVERGLFNLWHLLSWKYRFPSPRVECLRGAKKGGHLKTYTGDIGDRADSFIIFNEVRK